MKKILGYGLIFASSMALAAMNHASGLRVQISQHEFEFKRSNVEQVLSAIMPDQKAAIMIKLKPEAALEITKMSESEIGQMALWIWNGKIVSMQKLTRALDKDITVFNIDPDEAEHFVKSLKSTF